MFQVFRVFRVFQVFQFRFWTKKTPGFGPNRNKTGVSRVPPQRETPHQASFRSLSLRIRPHSFSAEQHLTQKSGMSD